MHDRGWRVTNELPFEQYPTVIERPEVGQVRTLPDGRQARCITVFRGTYGDGIEYLLVAGTNGAGGWMTWRDWQSLA